MKTIHLLPRHIISKIAAGEVVERPASALKELIENSVDAHAQHIDIELEDAGIKKMIVCDDGFGMNEEDIFICSQPHTTSKIISEDDLMSIRSFGFRGEALSSICAVSRLIIKSRPHGTEHGMLVEMKEGEMIEHKATGMAEGTEIIIESLFSGVPARKKFLKATHTELRYCIDTVARLALAFPHIAFRLIHNKQSILNLPQDQTLLERMENLQGVHVTNNSLPLNHKSTIGKISGYIGKPQIARRAKNNQYLFINQRSVTDSQIAKVIAETYGNLLEPRSYPPFTLFISLPYENVDVNIHPRKEEVSFSHPHLIHALIREALTTTLKGHDLGYGTDTSISGRHYKIENDGIIVRDRAMDNHMASLLKSVVIPWNTNENINVADEQNIMQLKNLYLITQTKNGLLCVDQHAAHERILFEQFKKAYFSHNVNMPQHTLTPAKVFDLSRSDAVALENHLDTFQKLGFDLEPFGAMTFKLSGVPEFFKERDLIALITEVLDDLNDGKPLSLDRETERTLSYLACRSAIKGGDPLSDSERKNLITKLAESDTPYTCPHGRPTHILLSMSELDRLFKRKM